MAVTVLAAVLALATADSSGVAKHSAAKIRVDDGNTRIIAATGGSVFVESADGTREDLIANADADRLRDRRQDDSIKDMITELAGGLSPLKGIGSTFEAYLNASLEEAVAAQHAQTFNEAASWLHLSKTVLPTNRPAVDLKLVGPGFAQYFHPDYVRMFTCTFTQKGATAKVETKGKAVESVAATGELFYVLSCPSPAKIATTTTFVVTAHWEDARGKVEIPFGGSDGRNELKFDMVWTTVNMDTGNFIVDVDGLDVGKTYRCKWTQGDVVAARDGAFVDGSEGLKFDCGKQPTGFDIEGIIATVKFELSIKGTTTKVTYAGPSTGSESVALETCKNGEKDGSETDVDCGGKCADAGFFCASQKKCKVSNDCGPTSGCNSGKCGRGSGKSRDEAGITCKQIKFEYPTSTNGVYWIQGHDRKFSPFEVYCWMADRSGGGWTLVLKMWYRGHRNPNFNFQGGIGSPRDGDLFSRTGSPYKLPDDKIRSIIDQEDKGKSTFEIMSDQSYHNTHYSHQNREYIILRNYHANWHFTQYTPVSSSDKKVELTSYRWGSHYNGSPTPKGDGEWNWKGEPRCGSCCGSGIRCYGQNGGNPSTPRGGRGCRSSLNNHHGWGGQLHYYMCDTNHDSYTYICSGAQHSSHNRFAHRHWFRTSDSQDKTA